VLELTVGSIGAKTVLQFEHSLLSLSKWEEKFNKAFLGRDQKTNEEMLDYYRMMLLSPEDSGDLVYTLSPTDYDTITKYINSTPGPTSPPPPDPDAPRHTGELVTADIIYMRMTLLRIPWQPAETWHVNRLMLQIALVADAQKPPKKESKTGLLQKWSDMNERNKAFFKSNG
jgi:hypothetical protein